jgi:hypothetical protein
MRLYCRRWPHPFGDRGQARPYEAGEKKSKPKKKDSSMSVNRADSSAPERRLRSPSSPLIGFFRHHGAWAPGVRLFRRLQFRAKAAIISAVFLLPLALISVALWQAKQEAIDFAEKERMGVAVYAPLGNFYSSLTRVRNATRSILGGHDAKADYAAARLSADAALAEFDKRLNDSGDPLTKRAEPFSGQSWTPPANCSIMLATTPTWCSTPM